MKRIFRTAVVLAVGASWIAGLSGCVTVNKPAEREVVVEHHHDRPPPADKRVEVTVKEDRR